MESDRSRKFFVYRDRRVFLCNFIYIYINEKGELGKMRW